MNVALDVHDSLLFNTRSPNDSEVPHRLDQDVADGGIRPHEHTNLFLEGIACYKELVNLFLCEDRIRLLQPLDNIEGDLVGSVAGSGVHVWVIGGQVLDLPLAESLLHFSDHLLHVAHLQKVVLQVADLHVGALDQVHFLAVRNVYLGQAHHLQSKLYRMRRDDVWNRHWWNHDCL